MLDNDCPFGPQAGFGRGPLLSRQAIGKPAPMVHHAEAYASLDLSVVRLHGIRAGRCTCANPSCKHPGKHPDVGPSLKRFMHEPAEPELLRRWFTEKPYANVGIVCGLISGIVVVDADGEEGVAELERRGYPTSWTARSGSGGLHLYLRHPGGYPVGNRKVPGVGDLRGDGGLIVAPPSRHVCGARYAWLPGRSPW